MSDSPDFAKLVPGFEFLQSLVKNAGSTLPNVGQWVAPTLDPEELDKRIGELRTVQFWLEQNAAMLGTTIQALEVQRMTLATLKTMNVQMADLRDALTIRMPEAPPSPAAAPAPRAAPESAPAPAPAAAPAAPAGVVDPMQWWSALTRQFTELAANAIRESAAEATTAAGAAQGGAPATKAAAPAAGRAPAKKAARRSAAAKRTATRRRSPASG
jgi:hypothetical protein